MILKELGQLLPNDLIYLDLNLEFDPNQLKIFFENCKHDNLRKLLIRNYSKKDLNTTLGIVKEFVKEKSLESLAYEVDICDLYASGLPHGGLEVLIKEIKHFVTMKNYNDLVKRSSDIDETLN